MAGIRYFSGLFRQLREPQESSFSCVPTVFSSGGRSCCDCTCRCTANVGESVAPGQFHNGEGIDDTASDSTFHDDIAGSRWMIKVAVA